METHPPQAASGSSTNLFHGVGTVNIIGGTFFMIGKLHLLPHYALLDNYQAVPSIDPGVNTPTTGTQTSGTD